MVLPRLVVEEMFAGVNEPDTAASNSVNMPVAILRGGGVALAMGGYAAWRWWRDRSATNA